MIGKWTFVACAIAMTVACDRPPATTAETPSTAPETAPPSAAKAEPAATTPTTTRTSDGRCEPMPKESAPCTEGDSYCVESWGSPDGHSSALWCREGRWEREQERNLPADE